MGTLPPGIRNLQLFKILSVVFAPLIIALGNDVYGKQGSMESKEESLQNSYHLTLINVYRIYSFIHPKRAKVNHAR